MLGEAALTRRPARALLGELEWPPRELAGAVGRHLGSELVLGAGEDGDPDVVLSVAERAAKRPNLLVVR